MDRWPLYRGQIKKEIHCWGFLGWPLWAGGCYIEVPVRPSLTVPVFFMIKIPDNTVV